MIFTLESVFPVSTSLKLKSLTFNTVDVSSFIVILVPFAVGASFTPVTFTVKVLLSLRLPSLELTVNVSVAFELNAFIALL